MFLAVILLAFSFASNAFAATSGSGLSHSFAYNLAVFITHPIVIPVLLTIGCVGLVMELFTPRLGLPGVIGISAFLLFFYGHLTAGLAGFELVPLFYLHWNCPYFIRTCIVREGSLGLSALGPS